LTSAPGFLRPGIGQVPGAAHRPCLAALKLRGASVVDDEHGRSRGDTIDDPHETLGVEPGATPEAIRAAYRALVRSHHPDRHGDDDQRTRAIRHDQIATITAAYRMLNDAKELERFRRLQDRRKRARASSPPGRYGVHFTAASPSSGGAIEPAPGDPDFDYRQRAPSEFSVPRAPRQHVPWTAHAIHPTRLVAAVKGSVTQHARRGRSAADQTDRAVA
jgi:curved DNA-binding protein CbpA